MPKHATPQELEEENKKLLEDLDKPEETPVPEVETEPEIEPPAEVKEAEAPEPEAELEPKVEPVSEPEPEPIPVPQIEPDYKKKFSESSKEAQKVVAKNRKLTQAIDEANELEEPSEDELREEYSDWDVLDDTTKRIAKESLVSSRRFALISKARVESKKIEKWDEDVTKFTDDPQTFINFPDLEGKISEFRVFANEESNTNVPFRILVNAFLHEQTEMTKTNKGSMFPTGSGGPNEKPKPKSDKISVEESETLRKNDYKKYLEYLRSGKIDNTVI